MQLPLEILAEIACISPAEIWTFASVCRHWRYATLVYPKCWNCIHIKKTEGSELQKGLEYRLNLWVERGGVSPLELLLPGPSHRFVLSEPFVGCFSRVRTLHLDSWPCECDTLLQPMVFPALEVLSISTPLGQQQTTISRVSSAFLEDACLPDGETRVKSPRLRELALNRVYINVPSTPKLGTLVTLKLVGCDVASSALLLDLLNHARRSLKTLCLQSVAKVPLWPPPSAEKLLEVEFQSLTSLTLVMTSVVQGVLADIFPRLASPSLIKLTCDDQLLQSLDPHRFPMLSNLYVRSSQSSSLKTYQKVFKKFNIVSLTILRDPKARCGLNVLLWNMTRDPEFGKSLRRLKYLTQRKALVQGLLEMLNKERHKSLRMAKGVVFASQEVIYEGREEYELPWDAELWWTKESCP